MNKLKQMFMFAVLATLCLTATAAAQDKKDAGAAEKNKYQNVEVAPFIAQADVKITPEELKALTDSVVKELQDIKKFKQVLREGETPSDAAAPTLKITGTVVKYKAGSRAKRYIVGFGAGKSKLIAEVKFIDAATGNVLYEQKADGDVVMGVFGGNSGGAKSELAEQVAKSAKKKFF